MNDVPAAEAAENARKILADGGIVAFPTETVYGLAIRGDDDSVVKRLFDVKDRPAEKHLARYVSHAGQTGVTSLRGRRLMDAFWPGPLTVVVEQESGETVGFRCSSHPFTAMMSSDDHLMVVGTSANKSGTPPLTTADEIDETFANDIELIVDNGGPLKGQATTVVLLPRAGGFHLLREGEVTENLIREELKMKIAFVCTGNTCRSPLAEAMFRDMISKREKDQESGIEYLISSAGTSAGFGSPASTNSLQVASCRGLDLSQHASSPVDPAQMASYDLILTMTQAHADVLASVLPECQDRIRPLAGPNNDIVDPFGGSLEVYEHCARDIENHLAKLMEEL